MPGNLGTPCTTDASGQFDFGHLPMGVYRVAQALPVGWRQTWPEGGSQVFELIASNVSVSFGNHLPPQEPYWNEPSAVPCLIQAEDFDRGGEGIAYHDGDPTNNGGAYRPIEAVDVQACTDQGGGYNVGWTGAGEWLEYTVNVEEGGLYELELRYALDAVAGPYAKAHLAVDGKDVTGLMGLEPTGGWQTYQTFTSEHFWMTGGRRVLRLQIDETGTLGYGPNINWFNLKGPQNRYTSHGAIGLIQAEDFDTGGQGIAYLDNDDGINHGGAGDRFDGTTNGVDIEPTWDVGGGCNIGWFGSPEWLEYTIYVETEADYRFEFRVASAISAQMFYGIETNGVVLTLPEGGTGDWQNWQTQTNSSGVFHLQAGLHVLKVAVLSGGLNLNWIRLRADGEPFNGDPFPIPGIIQAEEYDSGPNGEAYLDDTPGNILPDILYRDGDDVDVEGCGDTGGTYSVAYIRTDEWLSYTVQAPATGQYDLEFRVAHFGGPGGTFHVEIDGADVTGPLQVPDTGGWQAYQTVLREAVTLGGGKKVLRVVFDTADADGFVGNLNWIRITPHHTPYTGTALTVPARIEAENFNWGANGVAYNDLDTLNSGWGGYRSWQDVDIRPVVEGEDGEYQVGWTGPGEWLDYTIEVPVAGLCDLDLRVASDGLGGQLHLEFRKGTASRQTSWMQMPDTGGWDTWQTITWPAIYLDAGVQVMRVCFDQAGATGMIGELNWIDIRPTPDEFRLSTGQYSVNESAGSVTITVQRVGGLGGSASVWYASSSITAASGSDYTSASGLLEFAQGQASQTFTVHILPDAIPEADETLQLSLLDPSAGASLGVPQTATLTIRDDDLPAVSIDDPPAVVEGDSGESFLAVNLRLSATPAKRVTVLVGTVDGTARSPGDYAAEGWEVVFEPGQTNRAIELRIVGDRLIEGEERMHVDLLSNPANATVDRGRATVTIIDDDVPGAFEFRLDQYNVAEGQGSATISVIRSGSLAGGATIRYATGGGKATANDDYIASAGELVFATDQTTAEFQVQIRDDGAFEGNEWTGLSLEYDGHVVDTSALVIEDDDPLAGTSGPDRYQVQLDPGGRRIEIVATLHMQAPQAYDLPLEDLEWLVIESGGGDDELLVDLGHGRPLAPGRLVFRGGGARDVLTLADTAGAQGPADPAWEAMFEAGDGEDVLNILAGDRDDVFVLGGADFTWGSLAIHHSGLVEALVSGGRGGDGLSLIAATPIQLPRPRFDGGEGDDTLTVGTLPIPLPEPVFTGGEGYDVLEVIGGEGDDSFTLSGESLGWGGTNVSHSGIEESRIMGGRGGDGLSLIAATPIQLPRPVFEGGDGDDTLTLVGVHPIPLPQPAYNGGLGRDALVLQDYSGILDLSFLEQVEDIRSIGAGARITSPQPIACLTLSSGVLQVECNAKALVVQESLTFQGDGALDLMDGNLVLGQAGYQQTMQLVRDGKLTSSVVRLQRVLATAIAGDLSLSEFAGQQVLPTSILVKYTWAADANFDELVTTADFAALSKGYVADQLNRINPDPDFQTKFTSGDFDGDGKVGTADFAIMSKAYVQAQIEKKQGGSGLAAKSRLFQSEKTIRLRSSHRRPVLRNASGGSR